MNNRIKELREKLDLSQTEFGLKIGKGLSTIKNYERGSVPIKNNIVILICKTFNVNEEWLRTGEGEMFVQENLKPKDSRNALITNALQHISDEEKDFILKYIEEREVLKKVSENQLNKKIG